MIGGGGAHVDRMIVNKGRCVCGSVSVRNTVQTLVPVICVNGLL